MTAAGAIAAVVAFLALVVWLAASMIDSHRAQVTAELAAVATAHALYATGTDPCAHAQEVARRNGGDTTRCYIDGEDALVTVRHGTREVTARAGPL